MNESTSPPKKSLVYHVNDNESVRLAVRRILERQNIRVEEFESGDQLLEQRPPEPDLFLLDVVMPGRDGFEICRKIRLSEHWANALIVMMSARFTSSEARIKGLEGGADGYVVWPSDAPVLAATILAYLRLRSTQRALALSEKRVSQLARLLPVCAWCNKVRDEDESWKRLDHYLADCEKRKFTHTLCPDCKEKEFHLDS